MVEALESTGDVIVHRDVDVTFFVVPLEVKTAVEVAGPVNGTVVVGLDGLDKM
jgi:hypothetical protein